MTTLRSLLYAILFTAGTTLIVLAGLPIALVSRPGATAVAKAWGRWQGRLAHHVLGIRLVIEGELPAGPVVYAAKHESAYETLALLALIPDPIIVLKRELSVIPLFGWLTRRSGMIPVDRAGSAAALRSMLRAATDAKLQHRNILIFPEGTRVPRGQAPALAAGFAGLYARLGLPVVPIATDAGIAWPRGLIKHSGVVRLRFGAPIAAGLPRKVIEAEVHAAINGLND